MQRMEVMIQYTDDEGQVLLDMPPLRGLEFNRDVPEYPELSYWER